MSSDGEGNGTEASAVEQPASSTSQNVPRGFPESRLRPTAPLVVAVAVTT